MLSANSLRWSAAHCANLLSSYDRFMRGKRWNHRGPNPGGLMVGDQTLPIENASGAPCCSCSVRPNTVIKEDNTWRQRSSSLVLNKEIELQYALHIWRETIVLGMFTGSLRAQNWHVRCVAIDGHTRDIVQHICAKFHLSLTVVLISRPIGPWKKNNLRKLIKGKGKGIPIIGHEDPCGDVDGIVHIYTATALGRDKDASHTLGRLYSVLIL